MSGLSSLMGEMHMGTFGPNFVAMHCELRCLGLPAHKP